VDRLDTQVAIVVLGAGAVYLALVAIEWAIGLAVGWRKVK
jgi:hypothetical protein